MKRIALCSSLILGVYLNFLFFFMYSELCFYQYAYICLFGLFGIFLSLVTRNSCNPSLSLLSLFFNFIPVIYITLYFLIIELFLI
ncbi:hypothetical protein A5804_002742 [Enterococcus faecium]|uniref:Uncharacterized protein n=1 Tax=Enterococcus faecium TaxID=1352 RepID=A0AB73N421_ENTFC|nr:hypothetical protein A5804_002742 [Enterococcus faecium]